MTYLTQVLQQGRKHTVSDCSSGGRMVFCRRFVQQHHSPPVNQNNEAGCLAFRPLNISTSPLFRPPTSIALSLPLMSAESITSHLTSTHNRSQAWLRSSKNSCSPSNFISYHHSTTFSISTPQHINTVGILVLKAQSLVIISETHICQFSHSRLAIVQWLPKLPNPPPARILSRTSTNPPKVAR